MNKENLETEEYSLLQKISDNFWNILIDCLVYVEKKIGKKEIEIDFAYLTRKRSKKIKNLLEKI